MIYPHLWLSLIAAAVVSADWTLLPSCLNTTNSDITIPVACLQRSDGMIATVEIQGNTLDLSNRNISQVLGVPPSVVSINLSQNKLSSFYATNSSLRTINLSGNYFNMFSRLVLPSSVVELDLSSNHITELDPNPFNLLQYPKLAYLNLSSNGLTIINKPTFPRSLQTLDLSDNADVQVADLSPTVFFFLQGRTVVYMTTPKERAAIAASCTDVGQLYYLSQGIVCVFDGARQDVQQNVQSVLSSLRQLSAACLAVVSIILAIYIMFKCLRRKEPSPAYEGRPTLTSSACEAYDLEPIQYRASVSPSHLPSHQSPLKTTTHLVP
ncbi:hypothetical protein AC1031_021521 [Aphanomyces cochlioides]|nr:hypothetical protein AC1031_021521 [Aphanomyces cochlioides]